MTYEEFIKGEYNKDILNLHPNNETRRKYLRDTFKDFELLNEVFNVREMSVLEFETVIRNMGFIFPVRAYCRELQISLPDSSGGNIRSSSKRIQTNLKRYGAENPLSRNTSSYEKRNQTIRDKYGVENVFELEDIKRKSAETCIKKYGVSSFNMSSFSKSDKRYISIPQQIVADYLTYKNVNFKMEEKGLFYSFNNEFNKLYSPIPDITILDKKIVIEVYGDYFHANPSKYMADDYLKISWKSKDPILVSEIWKHDEIRKNHIEKFGYTVHTIWESSINDNSYKDQIDEIIKNNFN